MTVDLGWASLDSTWDAYTDRHETSSLRHWSDKSDKWQGKQKTECVWNDWNDRMDSWTVFVISFYSSFSCFTRWLIQLIRSSCQLWVWAATSDWSFFRVIEPNQIMSWSHAGSVQISAWSVISAWRRMTFIVRLIDRQTRQMIFTHWDSNSKKNKGKAKVGQS
jgi:hypothetical protein